jgi:hypothetical protein
MINRIYHADDAGLECLVEVLCQLLSEAPEGGAGSCQTDGREAPCVSTKAE